MTLLMKACEGYHSHPGPTISLLVDRGVNLHARDNAGMTALMYAARTASFEAISVLISMGSSVRDQDTDGCDALLWLLRCLPCTQTFRHPDYLQSVYLLLESGADVNLRESDGFTPILLTLRDDCEAVAEALLLHGANPNEVFQSLGTTALMEACHQGCVKIVKLLLDQGADPLAKDHDGHTAAHHANRCGNIEARDEINDLLAKTLHFPGFVLK
jgi:ankyrin repeat protein